MISGNGPHNPETPPFGEEHDSTRWFDHGLIALDWLRQKQAYQAEAVVASNNFLALVHRSGFRDPGIVTYKRQERDANEQAQVSLMLAKYNVAVALGIEADDPLLPESAGSLNIKDSQQAGYLSAAFFMFLRYYDNVEIVGHIQKIKEGEEELELRPAIDTTDLLASNDGVKNGDSEPRTPEEIQAELESWLNHPDTNGSGNNPEALFNVELTPAQRDIRQGSLYLLGAQVAIGLKNRRDTYDPLLHDRSTPPLKHPEKERPPLSTEGVLRERLRKFHTEDLVLFADLCISHGAAYIPALKTAGLLPEDYPEPETDNPEKTVNQYRQRFSVPSDPERTKHRQNLKRAVASPQLDFVPRSRSQKAKIQQDSLFE